MTKQTATNNEFLATTKETFNDRIFKKASKILNEQGESKAREYVQTFTTSPLSY